MCPLELERRLPSLDEVQDIGGNERQFPGGNKLTLVVVLAAAVWSCLVLELKKSEAGVREKSLS